MIQQDASILPSKEIYRGLMQQSSLLEASNALDLKLLETSDWEQYPMFSERFKRHKIGRIAEEGLSYYFSVHPRYVLLSEQLVIRNDGETIGELDYVLWDRHLTRYLHVELACKFYLYEPAFGAGLGGWVGPNRNDFLYEKLQRLKDHQLPIAKQHYSAKRLQALGVDIEMLAQKVCIKGFLFTRPGVKIDAAMQVNEEAFVGHYYFISELDALLGEEDEVCIIPKSLWMLPANDHIDWQKWSVIKHLLNEQMVLKHSSMLWIRRYDKLPQCIFVVWW